MPEDRQFADEEESTEDGFVVRGHSNGQVDIEIGGAVRREAGGEIGQGAAKMVEGEDQRTGAGKRWRRPDRSG